MRISPMDFTQNIYSFSSYNQEKFLKDSVSLERTNAVERNNFQFPNCQYLFSFGAMSKKEKYFYCIDKDGSCKRYESHLDVLKDLNFSSDKSSISACLHKKQKTAGDYIFVLPEEIESVNQDGKKYIDEKKVKKAINERLNYRSIYAIDSLGNYKKYSSPKEASIDLNVNSSCIYGSMNGAILTTGKYIFVKASDIEKQDEEGNQVLDSKKLNKEMLRRIKDRSVYSIDMDGNVRKFERSIDAANFYSIHPGTLSGCLVNNIKVCSNHIFVPSSDIEIEDENGEKTVDFRKVNQIIGERTQDKRIYVIDKDLNVMKFDKAFDASETLNIRHSEISACVNQKKKTYRGYIIVKASDVEYQDEKTGRFLLSDELVQKVIKERTTRKKNGI